MIENIYTIVSLQILPGMLIAMSVCLFFLTIPVCADLHKYRFARRCLGCAYLVYAMAILVANRTSVFTTIHGDLLSQSIVLIISCFQAFLFTYTLITMLDVHFLTPRRIRNELLPLLLIIAATFVLHAFCQESVFRLFFYFFALFYAFLLVRYVVLFRLRYRLFRDKMDNYYSNDNSWVGSRVCIWFYAALGIGIMGLCYAFYITTWSSLLFITVVALFYILFGISFLNYPQMFLAIESAISTKESACRQQETSPSSDDEALMSQIDTLIHERQMFMKADLTVNDIASVLNVNPRTVSATINRCKHEYFRTYISEKRVQQAKRLILENRNLTMEAIGKKAGFASKSTFYRIFKSSTGFSPADFLQNQ